MKPGEISSGRLTVKNGETHFWGQLPANDTDIVTPWETLFARRVVSHAGSRNTIWLGKTVTRRMVPGETISFERTGNNQVHMIPLGGTG